jgi:hypothetical protein
VILWEYIDRPLKVTAYLQPMCRNECVDLHLHAIVRFGDTFLMNHTDIPVVTIWTKYFGRFSDIYIPVITLFTSMLFIYKFHTLLTHTVLLCFELKTDRKYELISLHSNKWMGLQSIPRDYRTVNQNHFLS